MIDDDIMQLVHLGDERLRDYINQEIMRVAAAVENADSQVGLALEAAEKLERERVAAVKEHTKIDIAAVVYRMEEGSERLAENIENLKSAVTAALDAQRLAVTIAQEASEKAINKALTSVDQRFAEASEQGKERLSGMQREVQLAQEASEKAIAKAEVAAEKRFESVNEFRSQLADQATSFLPRETFDQVLHGWGQWRDGIEGRLNKQQGSSDQLRRAQDRAQPWMIWVAGAIVAIAVVLSNHL